jgi:uncharacterized damage-inducible protein DinB
MLLKRYFLEQLEREAAASRKVVERVPEGQNSWKPHERSMELGLLAALVATMPGWLTLMIDRDELDLDDPSSSSFRTKPVETRAELLRLLDQGLSNSRTALENTTEAHLQTSWRLKMNGQVLSDGPRYSSIADGALSHLAHHRGQLTVYLRLNEAKVPAIYGPSADEWH